MDSFENLVLGILRFWRETGEWPEKITVVSHEFKRERLLDLYVKAMRWPRKKVEFVGVDPGYMVQGSGEWGVGWREDGECSGGGREKGFKAWEEDLFGKGEGLLRGLRSSLGKVVSELEGFINSFCFII